MYTKVTPGNLAKEITYVACCPFTETSNAAEAEGVAARQ